MRKKLKKHIIFANNYVLFKKKVRYLHLQKNEGSFKELVFMALRPLNQVYGDLIFKSE